MANQSGPDVTGSCRPETYELRGSLPATTDIRQSQFFYHQEEHMPLHRVGRLYLRLVGEKAAYY